MDRDLACALCFHDMADATELREQFCAVQPIQFYFDWAFYVEGREWDPKGWHVLSDVQMHRMVATAVQGSWVHVHLPDGPGGGFRRYDFAGKTGGPSDETAAMTYWLFKHCRSDRKVVVRLAPCSAWVGAVRMSHRPDEGFVYVQVQRMLSGDTVWMARFDDEGMIPRVMLEHYLKEQLLHKHVVCGRTEIKLLSSGPNPVMCPDVLYQMVPKTGRISGKSPPKRARLASSSCLEPIVDEPGFPLHMMESLLDGQAPVAEPQDSDAESFSGRE